MSSKVRNMTKQIQEEKTQQAKFRVDLKLDDMPDIKSAYIIIGGIPDPLPPKYKETILYAARQQFSNALNSRSYLELFDKGKTAIEQSPTFYNINLTKKIEIVDIIEVEL